MKKNIFTTMLSIAALLLCGIGCTDMRPELKDGLNESATETLWQQIQARGDLKDFAEICSKTPFRTSETNKPYGFTFQNLLESNTNLTVFAPVDGSYDKNQWLKMLAEGKEWEVQTQFITNHIRRNHMEIAGSADGNYYMLNMKPTNINSGKREINGVKMTEVNIEATNGVLHILEGVVPFRYNIHEYMQMVAGENAFARHIISGDSIYFDNGASIEGAPDEDGRITYLDSVFTKTNQYWRHNIDKENPVYQGHSFTGLGFPDIACEDSTYCVFLPSDAAYAKGIEMLRKYFNYGRAYEDNAARNTVTSNKDRNFYAVDSTIITAADADARAAYYLDSLAMMWARSTMYKTLVYNMRSQFRGPQGSQTEVIDAFDTWKDNVNTQIGYLNQWKDTLRSMPYYPAYRKNSVQRDADGKVFGINWDLLGSMWEPGWDWDCKSIFCGAKPKERLSNGLIYEIDNYNFDPRTIIHKDIIVQVENSSTWYQNYEGSDVRKWATMGKIPADTITEKYGKVSGNYMVILSDKNADQPTVSIRLDQDVLSATYDIYMVTVPYGYYVGRDHEDAAKQAFVKTTINYLDVTGLNKDKSGNCTYSQMVNNSELADKDGFIPVCVDTVQTVLLFKDFKFPCSYAHLNRCYPTLTISVNKVSQSQRNKRINRCCIDMIYLKAKKD